MVGRNCYDYKIMEIARPTALFLPLLISRNVENGVAAL